MHFIIEFFIEFDNATVKYQSVYVCVYPLSAKKL